MDKEIWTWILNHGPDELLLSISKQLKVKIKGFRESNYQKNLTIIKDKLIQQMVSTKNIFKLKIFVNQWINETENGIIFRNKKMEFLYEYVLIEKQKSLLILLSLISSPNDDEHFTGVALYNKLKQSVQLPELEKNLIFIQDHEEQQKLVDGKISKLESTISENSKLIKSKEEKINTLLNQQKHQKQEIEKLKKELDNINQLLEESINESINNKKTVDTKQSLINNLEKELNNLKDQLKLAKSTIQSFSEVAPSLNSHLSTIQEEKVVLLIGNKSNKGITNKLKSQGYKVIICNDTESMRSHIHVPYIWIIEYQISSKLKWHIRNLPQFKNMTTIQDHTELKQITNRLLKGEI
jgi:hypothetical protein